MTDSIIRSCLNIDGGADREKGLYANLSNVSHVEIGFQRSTPLVKLEAELNRLPTDEEIERAKKNPYSVDEVFCKPCEDIFTEIENEFTEKILKKLRGENLDSINALVSAEVKAIRLFAYIQFWRSSVCVPEFDLPKTMMDHFRKWILNNETVTTEELTVYPLSVTYLETLGGPEEFTKNYIAHLRFKNPFIIIMNDFILQLYENGAVRPFAFYNINEGNFQEFINHNELEFKIRTLHNLDRTTFIKSYTLDIAKERIKFYGDRFVKLWGQLTGVHPSKEIVQEYLFVLTKNDDESILNYTQAVVTKITTDFVASKLNISQ